MGRVPTKFFVGCCARATTGHATPPQIKGVVQRALPPQTEACGMPFSRNASRTVAPGKWDSRGGLQKIEKGIFERRVPRLAVGSKPI
jgi:hypothetical protein